MTQPYYEYLHYQVEDFVIDPSFQEWILHPDAASSQFWQQFIARHPTKRELMEEAAEIIKNISYQPKTLSKSRQEQILRNVYAQAEKSTKPVKSFFFRKVNLVAATITLLLIVGAVYWLTIPRYEVYATTYQEIKTIKLSDGSEVTLNANTELKVNIDTKSNRNREVWLQGEAYFHVNRLDAATTAQAPNLRNFVVHTDNLDIEVLGTIFNVTSRSRTSEVLLRQGKVKVASQQIEQTKILQPGDLLTLSEEDKDFHLKKKNEEPAWKENFFIFENTSLKQVARAIENYYGLKVTITDPQLADKIFTAKVSRNELPVLLKAIEASFGVRVIQQQGSITIEP